MLVLVHAVLKLLDDDSWTKICRPDPASKLAAVCYCFSCLHALLYRDQQACKDDCVGPGSSHTNLQFVVACLLVPDRKDMPGKHDFMLYFRCGTCGQAQLAISSTLSYCIACGYSSKGGPTRGNVQCQLGIQWTCREILIAQYRTHKAKLMHWPRAGPERYFA